ncbi:mosc domain protein [Candidatus Pelagibacter sp. HTCC7211]|uniref:MOSC domain-containing protein n=1 Tax=Pelagibacter sp. (strain HTCC7211) TaxID=439493 RepID=UPI0001839088|nr:MOSC domain-containing protein [Candidatus Pelagibacter sp. HTCC7211]EDZ60526.1 mosc domain protein [Candidatus Pelagibacter sp. HTCC7211]
MSATISSINYCPVKSVSFQTIENCIIKKDIGIVSDRIFAFAKDLDKEQAKLFEKSLDDRKGKWNKVLTLKNSPVLNKYNFIFKDEKLTLTLKDKEILTIDINQSEQREELSNKISELESSLKQPITLMKNHEFPFFDTSISNKVNFVNSVSLLNIQSINDFREKIDRNVESSIFRGNICIDGIEPWKEREWIGKIIKINNVSFKVEKNIPRCVAINLKPQTDDNTFNLLQLLKKTYNHFEMGIYLTALDDGEINIGDTINI